MDANGATAIPGTVVTMAVLWGLLLVIIMLGHRLSAGVAPALATSRRPLKPKTGDDCPLCKAPSRSKAEGRAGGAPRPWCDVRSWRGVEPLSMGDNSTA